MRRLLIPVVSLTATIATALGAQVPEPRIEIDTGCGTRLQAVLIPPGRFVQGSPATERGRGDDEAEREVEITRAYYLATTPVTRGQFACFARETGYRSEAEKGTSGGFGWDGTQLVQRPEFNWKNPGFTQDDTHPVVIVTYDDALAYAQWLGRRSLRNVSLPTEAQWEYAARGGTRTRFALGDADAAAARTGWYKANAGKGTQAVAQKEPNAWGLHDMAGNVYEWCRDWYAPYTPGPVVDPEELRSTLSDKPRRVLRGGSWLTDARRLRSASRYRNAPGSRNADNGFRVVLSAETLVPATPPGSAAAPAGAAGSGDAAQAGGGFGVVFVTVLSLVTGILVLLVRSVLGRRGAAGVRTRPADDGFWLEAPKDLAGHSLAFRYTAQGLPATVVVTAEAARQFVYTGGRPSGVTLVEARGAAPAATPAKKPKRGKRDERRDDEPFSGYPSAY